MFGYPFIQYRLVFCSSFVCELIIYDVTFVRENHHYYNETQTFTLTLRNPRSHATTRQDWLKTPGWEWQGSTKHKVSIHACTFN